MKTSTFEKGIPMLPRVGACLAVFLCALAFAGTGCNQSAEGDRCNPLRTSDECGSGLVCSGNPIGIAAANPIAFCPENYCCPANGAASSNPNCQPGCNGGAAAICATSPTTQDAACALANGTPLPSDDAEAEGAAAPEGGGMSEAGEASTSD
jgi:hypothetical protein